MQISFDAASFALGIVAFVLLADLIHAACYLRLRHMRDRT